MNQKNLVRWLKSHRVAVLKGGWSRERPISLKTGAAVEESLNRLGIPFRSIDVTPNILNQLKSKNIKFCFLALHGSFGEDGGIQSCLDFLKIPYTGCGALSSALAMNKVLSKQLFKKNSVPTPDWLTVSRKEFKKNKGGVLKRIRSFMSNSSIFVKPSDQGSAIGASRVNKSQQISKALTDCFRVSQEALIEKFIEGRELTIGVLGAKTLPVIEIVPTHNFYDFHSKYAPGGSQHLVPAPLKKQQEHQARKYALKAFQSLGCSVYGRVDILLTKKNQMYVLEVNTIPGMTKTSLLPEAAKIAGFDFDNLVLQIVDLSLQERGFIR
jgi:D-alanine-D-alanine ligase